MISQLIITKGHNSGIIALYICKVTFTVTFIALCTSYDDVLNIYLVSCKYLEQY